MATEREFVSRGKCQSMHESNTITSSMICARGSGDTCEGNPGGSLTCSKDLANGQELRYLCGILSWGADCNSTASSDYPDVYTDVSKYEEWMLKRWWKISTHFYVLNANISLKLALETAGDRRILFKFLFFSPSRYTCQYFVWYGTFRRD